MLQRTTFLIQHMDCPAEEQLVRLQLAPVQGISALEFDLPARRLAVYHADDPAPILAALESLDLGARLERSSPAALPLDGLADERRLLWQVLGINLFFFGLELLAGLLAESMGLLADSLDMLADSLVYALALLAVGGSLSRKLRIAHASGIFQAVLAVFGLLEVLRRVLGVEQAPDYLAMIFISLLALGGNAASLFLLQKSRSAEAHIQASLIFTSNDVIANLGVIMAGVLVLLTGSNLPDLVVGALVFALVARGAIRILRLAG